MIITYFVVFCVTFMTFEILGLLYARATSPYRLTALKKFVAKLNGMEIVKCTDFESSVHYCWKKSDNTGYWVFYPRFFSASYTLAYRIKDPFIGELKFLDDGTIENNWLKTWEKL